MNKLEEKLDKEFAKLQVTPRIYHFTKGMAPFTGITLATIGSEQIWQERKSVLKLAQSLSSSYSIELNYIRGPASRLLRFMEIHSQYPHGLAICNHRDQFSRQRGRIIAKGRLLKSLEKNAQK